MRRTVIAALLLAAPVAPLSAQATRSISASDKAQGAQANPELLAQYGGKYAGPQVAFVDRVGKRVALQSGLSNAADDFTITLLNSPIENAFAIPGGYVYVTRQLLALMNSEAELASVLGHEVGHVAANHASKRNTRATIGSILAAGIGAATGSSLLTQIAGTGAQLYTLGFSRGQEYQADGLGVRYSYAAGYSPYAMSRMLTQLNNETTLQGQIAGRTSSVPSFASTHPNGAARIAKARELARATGRPEDRPAQDSVFLKMLDGMVYDDDPAQGVVSGQTFRHPALRIAFTAPAGYQIANGTDAVTILGSGGQAQFSLGTATADLGAAIAQRFTTLGANGAGVAVQSGRTNGIDYSFATTAAAASGRAVDATVVAYRFPNATYLFTLITPQGSGMGPFGSLVSSMTTLSASEAAAVKGKRVRIVTVGRNDTIDSLAAKMAYPSFQRERFLTLNGLTNGSVLSQGMLMKIIVEG